MLPDTTSIKRTVGRWTVNLSPRNTGHPNYELDVHLVAWMDGQQLRFEERNDLPDSTQGFLMALAGTRLLGFWAPTIERRAIFVHLEPRGMIPLPQAHTVIADHLDTHEDATGAYYAGLLRSGNTSEERTLPWGYARNAAAMTAAVLLCCAAIARGRSAIAAARQRRRESRGQCVSCGYPLHVSGATGCPECGWRRDDRSNAAKPTDG